MVFFSLSVHDFFVWVVFLYSFYLDPTAVKSGGVRFMFYIPYPPSVGLLWGLLHSAFIWFDLMYIGGFRNVIY